MIMDQFVEQLRQVSPLSDEIVGQLLEEMKEEQAQSSAK